jgi:hypothetical protein
MNRFVIQNTIDPDFFWSNTDGWVDDDNFDTFSLDESETLRLPVDGAWVRLATL